MLFVRSVIQVVLGRPQDLLPSILPSISCSCDVLCLIRCPRCCSFLVLNCRTIPLPVPVFLNSLVLLGGHPELSSFPQEYRGWGWGWGSMGAVRFLKMLEFFVLLSQTGYLNNNILKVLLGWRILLTIMDVP